MLEDNKQQTLQDKMYPYPLLLRTLVGLGAQERRQRRVQAAAVVLDLYVHLPRLG